jgi:hypothetical protein
MVNRRGISQNTAIIVGTIVLVAIILGYAASLASNINTIIIRVQCSGPWTGNYSDMSGQQSMNGSGDHTFTLERKGQIYWVVSVVFQKQDWGAYPLTVSLETPDGEVLESQSTTAEFGLVTITWSTE